MGTGRVQGARSLLATESPLVFWKGVETVLDVFEIYRRLPHRFPMLMVDKVLELVPGERAVAVKCVSVNEPHFLGHYPEHPIMPGVLIVEAMAQVGGLAMLGEDGAQSLPLLAGIEKARFRKPVQPGDQLRIESKVVRARASIGKVASTATVEESLVAEAELLFSIVEREK